MVITYLNMRYLNPNFLLEYDPKVDKRMIGVSGRHEG
jgi:hypothetical protein